MSDLYTILGYTLLWATIATALVAPCAIAIAYALARCEFRGKRTISTLFSLPMVLPPTAVGYLLLRLLSDSGLLGREALGFDLGILFSWKGVVLACSVMSFPLVVRAARVSFEGVDPRLESMSRTLGYNRLQTFFRISLPLARRGLAAAAILGFTRSMGEFGATVMLAGNIPGRTQTLASAIYSAQQAGDGQLARVLLIIALASGFIAVYWAEWLTQPKRKVMRS